MLDENREPVVNVRSAAMTRRRVRRVAVLLPAVALAAVSLTACDTKVGTAAIVNGQKISEKTLNSYLTQNAQPIQGSSGSVSARFFVLQTLITGRVVPALVAASGSKLSAADTATLESQVTQQFQQQGVAAQIAKVGLSPSFYSQYLAEQQQLALLKQGITDQAALTSAIKKADLKVSISPRYGSWDAATAAVTDLNHTQLPDAVTITSALPGDTASATPSQ